MSPLAAFTRACARAGLDLAQPFAVGWYNEAVEVPWRLPDFGAPTALGVLVANSRALWPKFLAWLAEDDARLEQPHPLDRFVVEHVRAAAAILSPRAEVRFSPEPSPRRFAATRLAALSGLASVGENQLAVHPRFGPWFAIRAVIVVDAPGPTPRPPPLVHPCGDCRLHCAGPFAAARAGATDWRAWLAVRDACPVGREHRYSDEQIVYHYTHDREVLRAAVGRAPKS